MKLFITLIESLKLHVRSNGVFYTLYKYIEVDFPLSAEWDQLICSSGTQCNYIQDIIKCFISNGVPLAHLAHPFMHVCISDIKVNVYLNFYFEDMRAQFPAIDSVYLTCLRFDV